MWLLTAYHGRGDLSRGKIWGQQFRIGRTIDHKERIEHKATAEDSQIGGVFALFVFYVAKIRPAFSATNFTNFHEFQGLFVSIRAIRGKNPPSFLCHEFY
ncbi:hypothetical protein [Candidatus Amarolinea dominans]|uniref:hypothetical protein n=1 Tax=Candidatus Amarolinea dominans TaxID=3140696 RepID=UPI0031357CFF|nr:hypothetical protein [Anaerolineae bacterium]